LAALDILAASSLFSYGCGPLLALQERGEVILKYCLALFEPGKRLLGRSCIPTSGFKSVDDTALSGNDPSTVTHVAARHGEFILYGRAL